ncbi:hypothetical protein XELAEV_18044857mg [Xenopus laevis]|uniref:Uncharacterized protein n=1 Tax=Xenopus laevis TaxID=8355 RepID=A0A974BZQ5_XENLA|nr:hypothetical protein XELAEV_18044857mg [Xenopus laevis]
MLWPNVCMSYSTLNLVSCTYYTLLAIGEGVKDSLSVCLLSAYRLELCGLLHPLPAAHFCSLQHTTLSICSLFHNVSLILSACFYSLPSESISSCSAPSSTPQASFPFLSRHSHSLQISISTYTTHCISFSCRTLITILLKNSIT